MAERMKIRMSLDDFVARFEEQPFEIIDGEIREMTPAKKKHSKISRRIYNAFFLYQQRYNTIEPFFETAFILEDISNWVTGSRVPDVMVYERKRYEAHEAENPDDDGKPFILVPDLVVEVISPTDKYTEVKQKIATYLNDGVKIIWIIDPHNETIEVYDDSDTPKTLRKDATLTGGEVLEGFELGVSEVFG